MATVSPCLRGVLVILVLATVVILVSVYVNFTNQLGKTTRVHSVRNARLLQGVPGCELPLGGYKAWNSGLVTLLRPALSGNCVKLLQGDTKEAERVKTESKKWTNSLSDEEFLTRGSSCSWLKEELSGNLYNSHLEKQFPLAYAFVIHNAPQQVFRLLKVLYRPQNTFCFHYDNKSSAGFKAFFNTMASCFENVIIPSKIEDIRWSGRTFLAAQINCLSDLAKLRKTQPKALQWKYVINLCGKELPLSTGREIVSRLIPLNGSSSISPTPNTNRQRLRGQKVPFNLPTYKNSAYNALSFAFVDYILNNETAQTVYQFFKGVDISEEHFYSTLYMQPGIPGGFDRNISEKLYFRVVRALWCFEAKCLSMCTGQWVHCVCILGSGDLPRVLDYQRSGGHLFHNKYFMEKDHTVMDCAEEMLVARNQQEFMDECKELTITGMWTGANL